MFLSLNRHYLGQYYKDDAVREKWDFLQSRLRCCGLRGTKGGYVDYLGPNSIEHLA